MRFFLAGSVLFFAPLLPAQQPIGRTSATEVQVSGAVDISHGEMLLGNGSQITAGEQAVKIALQRGGSLRLCSTTSVHLAKDRSIDDPASSALMMALDRGAIEANYVVGKYSNHGADAPYVTVTSQLEGGAYRVMPDQRVNFQHGSLSEVVDHEPEPCGCPAMPVTSVASTGNRGANPAAPGKPVGGPSSTPADTAFPIAESEGLAPPPTPHTPVVPAGQTHAEVTVPLTYNGENPAAAPPAAAPATPPPPVTPDPPPNPQPEVASAPPPTNPSSNQTGVFHRIGRFFSRIFGR
jgi:hypothetical protein